MARTRGTMKIRTVALWAAFGVVASSAGAMAIPVPRTISDNAVVLHAEPNLTLDHAHFTSGQTLTVDGRLGHSTLAKTGRGETFFFASVTGTDAPGVSAPPLNLAIVVDRSGSMKGDRI